MNSLGELTNHLETIIRNRKHIKNLPPRVIDTLPDILSDMRTNHKSATAVILQGPSDERLMSERVENFPGMSRAFSIKLSCLSILK